MFSDFNRTMGSYRWAVCNLIPKATRIGWAERAIYALQDESYAYWLDQLARRQFQTATPQISNELLTYYRDPDAPFATRKNLKQWNRLLLQLEFA